jgi:hypothetical protein
MICGVTGGRSFSDRKMVKGAMEVVVKAAIQAGEPLTVVHGGCRGPQERPRDSADWIVHEWCTWRASLAPFPRITVEIFPADWGAQGKGAGPKRNQRMVDYVVQHVDLSKIWVRFPGGVGTADCAERAARVLQVVDAELLDGLQDLSEL